MYLALRAGGEAPFLQSVSGRGLGPLLRGLGSRLAWVSFSCIAGFAGISTFQKIRIRSLNLARLMVEIPHFFEPKWGRVGEIKRKPRMRHRPLAAYGLLKRRDVAYLGGGKRWAPMGSGGRIAYTRLN